MELLTKTLQAKLMLKPWITNGIRTSIKIKNKLFASDKGERYKYYRNIVCHLIRISKRNYFHNYFNNNIANMKKMWKGISNVLNQKKKYHQKISSIKDTKKEQFIERSIENLQYIK